MSTRAQINGNPVARSPLLRKGGVHQRGRSGERQQAQHLLGDLLDEWHEELHRSGASYSEVSQTDLKQEKR